MDTARGIGEETPAHAVDAQAAAHTRYGHVPRRRSDATPSGAADER